MFEEMVYNIWLPVVQIEIEENGVIRSHSNELTSAFS